MSSAVRGYLGPVVEHCPASPQRFEKGRDLIGAIVGVERHGRLWIASLPSRAVSVEPLLEGRNVHRR
jgi:hypothetical protein